jgi:hypothetical protein
VSDHVNRALGAVASDVALQLVSQPDLFPPDASGLGRPLLSPADATRRTPSGKILAQDEQRCLLVAALRELGLSDRRISAMTGVARESIGPILMQMERAGKVRPLKERLTTAIGLLAEESTQAARELVQSLRDGDRSEGVTMALRALGPMVGITAEKVQLLTGGPTEILETRVAAAPEDEAAFLARLTKRAAADLAARTVDVTPLPDSESDGHSRNALARNGSVGSDTSSDTTATALDLIVAGDRPPAPMPAEGAGGVTAAAPVTQVDGSRGCEISDLGAKS